MDNFGSLVYLKKIPVFNVRVVIQVSGLIKATLKVLWRDHRTELDLVGTL